MSEFTAGVCRFCRLQHKIAWITGALKSLDAWKESTTRRNTVPFALQISFCKR